MNGAEIVVKVIKETSVKNEQNLFIICYLKDEQNLLVFLLGTGSMLYNI